MNHPLIIFGAGASYDFLRINRQGDQHILNAWKPPLTNNIFDANLFGRIVGKYEDVKQLASAVNNLTDTTSTIPFDFETYLTELESKYPDNNYKKIIALRFYLAELFGKISFHFYRHTNNHNHLLYEIQNRGLKACFVNYNYDTLLEKNIPHINESEKIDSYIEGDIKVVKMHGAHNWRYSPEINVEKTGVYDLFIKGGKEMYEQYKNHDVYPFVTKSPDFNSQEFDLNVYREHKENGFPGGNWLYYLPALAIPIGTKGNHVCPKKHIDTLIEQIKQTDRILIIGWRAQDEYLLTLIKEHLPQNVKLTVVTGGNTSLNDFIPKIKDITQIAVTDITFNTGGYSEFMVRKGYEVFFS